MSSKVQKRAVKIITVSYLAYTLPICFFNLKIPNIYTIYNFQVLIFMLKHKKGIAFIM